MSHRRLFVASILTLSALACAHTQHRGAPSLLRCADCATWNAPQSPIRVYGNTYWVGPHGLGSVLVTSPGGNVLIDGALPQSAAEIIRHGERVLDSLPCDILMTTHPGASNFWERVAARDSGNANALIDPPACKQLAASARQSLARRIAREHSTRALGH